MIRRWVSAVLAALFPSLAIGSEEGSAARAWIAAAAGHEANWVAYGTLALPSGTIFIGDPSWTDGHHLRGNRPVGAASLDVWLLISADERQVHAVWLEAAGTLPGHIEGRIDFGMDSAYFAFGDLGAGQALASIGDLGLPDQPDSFEFFLPHVQNFGFTGIWLTVPPDDLPVFAVETKRDGGLGAVWVQDSAGGFSGILIDISGRASDQRYIDILIEE